MKRITKLSARLLLCACLVSLAPVKATAWSGEGHRIVAKIAKWRLEQLRDRTNNQQARRALIRIARIFNARPDVYDAPTDMESASIWPDGVRANRDAPEYAFTSRLHFTSIPLDPNQNQDRFIRSQHCAPNEDDPVVTEGDCSVGGLEHFRQVLLTSNDDKALLEALSFVIHFTGDLHQPLHNAEDQQFPNDINYNGGLGGGLGDRGSNLRYVFYLNQPIFDSPQLKSCYEAAKVCTDYYERAVLKNLHAVWDKHMIQTEMAIYREPMTNRKLKSSEAKYAVFLERALPDNPLAQEYAQMAEGDPVAWSEEAHDLAEKNAYNLPARKNKQAPADNKVHVFFHVSNAYQRHNIKIVERQLQRAGIRLAAFLMSSFD